MPENYFVGTKAQSDGCHAVHKSGCKHLSRGGQFIDLGIHLNLSIALKEAGLYFEKVRGCDICIGKSNIKHRVDKPGKFDFLSFFTFTFLDF